LIDLDAQPAAANYSDDCPGFFQIFWGRWLKSNTGTRVRRTDIETDGVRALTGKGMVAVRPIPRAAVVTLPFERPLDEGEI
jgi:hypothetical protein